MTTAALTTAATRPRPIGLMAEGRCQTSRTFRYPCTRKISAPDQRRDRTVCRRADPRHDSAILLPSALPGCDDLAVACDRMRRAAIRLVLIGLCAGGLGACTGDQPIDVHVSGHLVGRFGPGPGGGHPIRAGHVRLLNVDTGRAVVVAVRRDGRYSATVRAGRYKVRGNTSQDAPSDFWCRASAAEVNLRSSRRHVDVVCDGP